MWVSILAHSDDRSDKVDALFEEFSKPGSPGLAITVMAGETILYDKGYGLAQLEYEIPISTETIFHVASVSKQFTTFAVVLLAHDGKLSLDDNIRKHLPDFPDVGHTVTVRHLIHHTSGIRDQWSLLMAAGWRMDDVITRDDIMHLLNNQRELNFPPGESFLYSNAGYTLLGEIVKNVSGRSLKDFAAERIFAPLNMKHTHFHDDHRHVVPNRAYSYSKLDDGGYEKSVLSYANVGATSLFTTGSDMMKWQRNFATGQVGGKEAIATMMQRGKLNDGRELAYGFALAHTPYKGLRTISHGGADAGFRSYLGHFPDQDLSIAVTGNLAQMSPANMAFGIADIYLEKWLVQETTQESENNGEKQRLISDDMLKKYKGTYLNEEINQTFKLLEKDGILKIAMGTALPTPLKAIDETRFRSADTPPSLEIQIETDKKNDVSAVHLTTKNSAQTTYVPARRPKRTAAFLEPLTGRYYSAEIDSHYDVTFDGKHLYMKRLKTGPSVLQPAYLDGFNWEGELIRFVRDGGGNPIGFRLNSGRILNLWFEKKSK
jgi:CubicO group peptidase (beta-lactamase class C family)